MIFNIDKVKVRIDHITVTSDDYRRLNFESNPISGYKYVGMMPTKNNEESKTYSIYHEYRNKVIKNKVRIFTRGKDPYYLPSLTIKFFTGIWKSFRVFF